MRNRMNQEFVLNSFIHVVLFKKNSDQYLITFEC